MFTFAPDSDTVIIDADAGHESGATLVAYDFADRPMEIWRRYIGTSAEPAIPQPWEKIDLSAKCKISGRRPAEHGKFVSDPVMPGQLLQYALTDPHSATARDPESAARIITIAGLLKQGGGLNGITDHGADIGGTFYRRKIDTGSEPTFVKLEVGSQEPDEDVFDVPVFARPVATAISPFSTRHDIHALPLMPGNRHFAALRVSDTRGRWSVLPIEKFTTLQREVTLEFINLRIENGYDPAKGGEAQVEIAVKEGDFRVAHLSLGDEQFKMADLREIPLNFTHVIGPKAITPDRSSVTIKIWGMKFNGWSERHEYAWNWDDEEAHQGIPFPIGPDRENVVNALRNLKAKPDSESDDFAFTVTMSYSVDYR